MDDDGLSDLRGNRFFNRAFELIESHPYRDEVLSIHAAVIVRGGKILSSGVNKPKRNMFVDIYAHHPKCVVHAECDAVLKARRKIDLRGAKMYVARMLKKNGAIAMSRPCPSCQKILKSYGIKRVYYTTHDGNVEVVNTTEFGR